MIRINDIVSLLDKTDGSKIEELELKYPEYKFFLKIKGVPLKAKNFDEKEYLFKIELSTIGLNQAIDNCDKILPKINKRLTILNNIQLISQIIVLISGAAILSSMQKDFGSEYNWIKYIAPSLVLLSSVLTLITKNKAESVIVNNQNLSKTASNLISLKNEAFDLINQLKVLSNFINIDRAEWADKCIMSSNSIAKNINEYLDLSGTTWMRK